MWKKHLVSFCKNNKKSAHGHARMHKHTMYSSCMTDLNVNVQRAISRALLPVLLKWIKGVQEVDRNHSPEIDTPPRDA